MKPNSSCCCGPATKKPEEKYEVTRKPCGREYLSGCGTPLLNTSFDSTWGKPLWFREIFKDFKGAKSPPSHISYEQIIRNGGSGVFNRDLADPAYEWDVKDPIWIYSSKSPRSIPNPYGDYIEHAPDDLEAAPTWPLSEKIAAAETNIARCDNPWYKLITHYPSVGRPFQNGNENPTKSEGLVLSSIPSDLFPGKQVEKYNYFPKTSAEIGNFDIREISHDKNLHTSTAYPGKYWISWWNAIHPGNVIGYRGVDIFNQYFNEEKSLIKCDDTAGTSQCDKIGCKGLTQNEESLASTPSGYNYTSLSSGEYHNCATNEHGRAICWGLTADNRTETEMLNFDITTRISCGPDWTVAIGYGGEYGITLWGNVSSSLKQLPEEIKKSVANSKKLCAGGDFCVVLKEDNKIILWGSSEPRLRIKPRRAIKDASLEIGETTYNIRKDEIIPFWGPRAALYNAVLAFEEGVDEFGTQNDPISTELTYVDIWAGKRHIVGYSSNYFKIAKADLTDVAQRIYGVNPQAMFPDQIETRIFSWGLGMPGDPYNKSADYVNQCCPNYWGNLLVDGEEQTPNLYPLNLLTKDYFDAFSVSYDDPDSGIENTIPVFTSSIANHTVFVREKYLNEFVARRKNWNKNGEGDWNGDPPKCMPYEVACPCLDSTGSPIPDTTQGIGEDCPIIPDSNGDYPCCYHNGYECCRNGRGLMFDGWGDDSNGQISNLGMRYFQPNYYTNSVNKNFAGLDIYAIKEPGKISGYSFKCALGPDRTVVSLTKYPPNVNKITSEIYHTVSGDSTSTKCLQGILAAYGGRYTEITALSCGTDHNIIIQTPSKLGGVDYPYIGEIDKGKKISWKHQVSAPGADTGEYADSPRIIMGSALNKNDWHDPEFDPGTASRLLFDLQVTIRKFKKQSDGNYKQIDYLKFYPSKTTEQPDGISVRLIGTRGDQRLKPFTGATCDCVWSDYATDSLKVGGHQGVILNDIGFDDRLDIKRTDKSYAWMEFNQLVGNGNGVAGGHEQPWVNFESAATKAFNDYNYNATNYWTWENAPNKPRINYWFAPPNTFTHNIIEIPPGRFPSQLSYYCRNKYCYGGPNNVIQHWCDPCFKGISPPSSAITGWKGRLGCTGCENNYNSELCAGCGFNSDGVWECDSIAPPIRDVYGYNCAAKVFGNILPDEIIINRTEKAEDDEIVKIKPQLKNKIVYQEEIVYRDGIPVSSESWKVGEVTQIKKRVMTFIPIEVRNEELKQKPLDPSKPFYFIILSPAGAFIEEIRFTKYTHKNYDNNCEYYNNKFMKLNSFGEPSTPIEESWPSLNRYFIPRWASLEEDNRVNTWTFRDIAGKETQVSNYTEIDYPLVVVPAHGGDIGTKYNMEGYVDTELFSIFNKNNPMFRTIANNGYPGSFAYNFMPGRSLSEFHKSRYIKDSIDFEYPFNKNVSGVSGIGHYFEFRVNQNQSLISFTVPPPGVFFSTKDIAYTNWKINGLKKPEPLCGDTETGCSSCAIPFTGAQIAAWGFDLYNQDLSNAIQNIIPELTGNSITDIEIGNLNSRGVWLGLASDRFLSSSGKKRNRIRLMFPIELAPGETIMFGRGVNIDNQSLTHLNDGLYVTVEVTGTFNQYPNNTSTIKPAQTYKNYEYRWGRFNDECACDSRQGLTDINVWEELENKPDIIRKYFIEPTELSPEEKAKLIIGDQETRGTALVKYANCTNPVTYLESGETPVLDLGGQESLIGLSDISSIWPIWEKSMMGNGYECKKGSDSYHLGSDGNDIIDPIRLYSGKGPDTGTIWRWIQRFGGCRPVFKLSGTGVRGFWSDWLSSRGYSTFLTSKEDKDRVGGDIPFEASHPQGWLGAGFVNSTDGYWTNQLGGDSIGDLVTGVCNWFPKQAEYTTQLRDQCWPGQPYAGTVSGTMWSSMALWNYTVWGNPDILTNYTNANGEGGPVADPCRPIPNIRNGVHFPRTQNKKKQILKFCCFGDKYLNEPPSAVTEAIMPDRYSINVRKNKYRNLYNAMFRATEGNKLTLSFRDWHGDPFNPENYTRRLRNKITPVWADYWWAWDYNTPQCASQYNWSKNIQEWRHRRWDLPLFIGVNRDNIGSFFINDPGCTPETCPGLEITDASYTLGGSGIGKFMDRLGWNYRKYDCITSQLDLAPGSLKWSTSVRGANNNSGTTIWPPRGCGPSCWKTPAGAPAYPGTFYAMNNAIWFNCYASLNIPNFLDLQSGSFGSGVVFSVDYSRWQPYFHFLGPGFAMADRKYDVNIRRVSWYK